MQNDYYTQDNHGPYEVHDIGPLDLEEGGTLESCKLAIATHGTLNEQKDNVILIPTWYSGTSKIWEDVYIGEGRALDPTKYFIIAINQIGSGLSSSPNNTEGAQGGPNFPKIRISDDVRAQHRFLTEKLGITELALVVGGSMGAQQTYEWAIRYPDMVKRAAPIAGTAKNTEHDFVYGETLRDAITSDPNFQNGHYTSNEAVADGMKRHAKIWTVMGWSTDFFRLGRHKDLDFPDVKTFVDEFMMGYFAPMDPNNLLTMLWKWQRGDVSRMTDGDLAAALGRIKAKTFVMPISHDMFFPPVDCLVEQKLIPNSEFHEIVSIDGHLALFGTDSKALDQVDAALNKLLTSPVS